MEHYIDKPAVTGSTEPLHHILWSLGRQWLSAGAKRTPRMRVHDIQIAGRYDLSGSFLAERQRDTTIQQLVLSLRMQGLDHEAGTMLDLLESLVMEGEISFSDFVQRVQNLFPQVLDRVDPALRVKIIAQLV